MVLGPVIAKAGARVVDQMALGLATLVGLFDCGAEFS